MCWSTWSATAQNAPNKTQLAQKCSLDTRTTKYIELMLGTGLIEQNDDNDYLRISGKGLDFLISYSKLLNFLKVND